jgi:hypothetical protein
VFWWAEKNMNGRIENMFFSILAKSFRELGISCTNLAKHLEMSQPGVGYAVSRGEKIAKKHKLSSAITSHLLIYGRIPTRPAFRQTLQKGVKLLRRKEIRWILL